MAPDWTKLDWAALERLREGFLSGRAASGPYWQSLGDLAAYDATYAERIGWKWDAVLRELALRDWHPPEGATIFDYGCGSGVAGRRVLEHWNATRFSELAVWDHSSLAREFAAKRAREIFPQLTVVEASSANVPRDALLVVSHVLNELSPADETVLRAAIDHASIVLWVEPGTSAVGRALQRWRESLLASGWHVVAPCPHELACRLLTDENAQHWCHHFAAPPPGIFADGNWVKFGQRAGIDLRSLPYSFLVLDRRAPLSPAPSDLARVIGRAEIHKAHASVLSCDVAGAGDAEIPKRSAPALHKHLDRARGPLLYRWTRVEGKIPSGEPWPPPKED